MFNLPTIAIPVSGDPNQIIASIRQIASALQQLSGAVSQADLVKIGVLTPAAAASTSGQSAIAALNSTIGTTITGLAQETSARAGADQALQTEITTEATSRMNGDTALSTQIGTAGAARLAGDNALQANLDAETTARTTAVSGLHTEVTTETSARMAADLVLQNANKFKVLVKAGAAVAGDVPTGTLALIKDSTVPSWGLYYNDAGTLKSVALT